MLDEVVEQLQGELLHKIKHTPCARERIVPL